MKHIIVTDSHSGVKKGGELYHEVNENLFAELSDYALENGITSLIHAGDFFDNRKSITNKTVLSALRIAERINDVFGHIFLITGNHDTIYKDDIEQSLLKMFEKYKNITIVNEPMSCFKIRLLPWLFPQEELKNKDNHDILIGHFDVSGATMNESGSISQGGIKQKYFKNWKMVLSGHFHTPGKYSNIQYLGSPFHTSFNDVAGTRGFYVLDDDTLELEFIEFTNYPHFIRVKDTDDVSNCDIKGNIVELIFTRDHGINDNITIIENFKRANPLTLTPKYVKIEESMSDEDINGDIEIKDTLGILLDYLESCDLPDHINPLVLGKIGESVYKETVDNE